MTAAPVILAIVRLAVFVLGAYLSYKKIAHHWYVGPIFAAVVLFWVFSFGKKLSLVRALGYFIASTLIYALVIQTVGWLQNIFPKKGDGLVSGDDWVFHLSVLVGSLLLPAAHRLFIGASWKRAAAASVSVMGAYLLMYYFGGHDTAYEPFINIVSIWQGAYLAALFSHCLEKDAGTSHSL